MNIDLNGKVILDMGFGTGDSLDVARELGASHCIAVDSDPYFVKLQLLRGHQTYLKDYTISRLSADRYFPIEVRGVDFIWSKGALNCVSVNNAPRVSLRLFKVIVKGFDFSRWVKEIKGLLNPRGSILFLPPVERKHTQIDDPSYPIKTMYWISDVLAWDQSYFSRVLQSEGFNQVKDIPHYNHPKEFPTAFYFQGRML